MLMTQVLSIKDTRDKLADVINRVAIAGDTFVITKFGKAKAMIVPVSQAKIGDTSGIEESFGVWSKRGDLKNSNNWVAKLRAKMSTRDE